MKGMIAAAIIFSGAAACVCGQSYSVAYTEGVVEMQQGSTWQQLNIGDAISPRATVRLGKGSYLEVAGAASKLALSQAGTYALERLLSESIELGSAGVGEALAAGLSALLGTAGPPTTTMGIRSEKAGEIEGLDWITSDAQVYLDSGREYIKAKDYDTAIVKLKQARGLAAANELPLVRYYLGYAYSLSGDTRRGLREVAGLEPDEMGAAAADLVLLKAKLLSDTNAFRQDVQWLTGNAALVSGDPNREALYYLILGISYDAIGDAASAKASLEKVVTMAGQSDVGSAAARLLARQ